MLAFLVRTTPLKGSVLAKVNGMGTLLSSASKGAFDPWTKLNRDSSVGCSLQYIVSMYYSVNFKDMVSSTAGYMTMLLLVLSSGRPGWIYLVR